MVSIGLKPPIGRKWIHFTLALLVLAAFSSWWAIGHCQNLPLATLIGLPSPPTDAPAESEEMVEIAGGRFLMGSDFSSDPAARPQHPVEVAPFWIDRHEVTNAQFAEFAAATGYRTTAEEHGEGWVFDPLRGQWGLLPGADWRHPQGPHSTIARLAQRPVVLVSWYDAAAYARWAGKRLPTEAEWELAARGGWHDADFPWGRQPQSATPAAPEMANAWQGWFPERDLGLDGSRELADVGSYPSNRFGLLDMSGNVCEWCADWYGDDYYHLRELMNPSGPASPPAGGRRVLRGGSWLSAENLGPELEVWARGSGAPEIGRSHIGFRCVRDADPHKAIPQAARNAPAPRH